MGDSFERLIQMFNMWLNGNLFNRMNDTYSKFMFANEPYKGTTLDLVNGCFELEGKKKLVDFEFKEGGIRNMCDVIDHYIHVGEEKGIAIGFEKGRNEGETIGFEKGKTIGFEKGEATTIRALADSGMNPE